MTDQERQARNRLSRAAGAAFEQRLDESFRYYAKTGYALVEKTPEPMKVIRSMGAGKFLACYTKQAQPDYKGTVKGGRAVCFEAKYTDKDRMSQERVAPQQAAYLDQQSALGARCWVLAGFSSGQVYRIPWDVWSGMQGLFGRKYVKEPELTNYIVQQSWNGTLMLF